MSPTTLEQQQQQQAMEIDDEDDWGFFVDTYDRFTPAAPTLTPGTSSSAAALPPGYVGF
jgi:hypothetical protein